jgi:hypothetical protein
MKYIENKYSYKQLFIAIYVFYIKRNGNQNDMCEIIDKMVERQDELDNKKFYSRVPRKSMVNEVEKLYEVIISDI